MSAKNVIGQMPCSHLEAEVNRKATNGEESTLHMYEPINGRLKRIEIETYDAVVGAADGVSTARVATDTDYGDGAAVDTNKSGNWAKNNTEQASEQADKWVGSL